jgi:hypothetical protein
LGAEEVLSGKSSNSIKQVDRNKLTTKQARSTPQIVHLATPAATSANAAASEAITNTQGGRDLDHIDDMLLANFDIDTTSSEEVVFAPAESSAALNALSTQATRLNASNATYASNSASNAAPPRSTGLNASIALIA